MGVRLRVQYRTDKADDVVKLGAFAQIAAKRRLGVEAVKAGDAEAALFGVFVELFGARKAEAPGAFDDWLQTIDDFEVDDQPLDPSSAGTSSDMSPESPPTSD